MNVDIEIICCFCDAKFKISEPLPHGWEHRYGGIDDALAFCEEHAGVAEWADSQCPGCVGGWTDCALWDAFAYERITLTEQDLASIEQGICPKRHGGTFVFSNGEMDALDLQERAPKKSGKALVSAIRQYWKTYKTERTVRGVGG